MKISNKPNSRANDQISTEVDTRNNIKLKWIKQLRVWSMKPTSSPILKKTVNAPTSHQISQISSAYKLIRANLGGQNIGWTTEMPITLEIVTLKLNSNPKWY